MALRIRNGIIHYRFKVDGHTYAASTDLADTPRNRIAAQQIENKARETVTNGQGHQLKVEARLFTDAAEAFLKYVDGEYVEHRNSADRLHTSFASLTEFFKRFIVHSITRGHVIDFKAWRRTEHQVKDVTIRHDMHALSLGYQYFIAHNWARINPVVSEDIPSDAEAVRMNILTLDDERLYFSEAWRHSALYDASKIILQQGCRPDEVLSFKVNDIDLAKAMLTIRKGKSKAARRTLRMTPEVLEICARRVREAPNVWLFPGEAPGTRLAKLNAPHDRVLDRLAVCRCGHRRKEHNGGRYHRVCKCGCQKFEEVSRLAFVTYDLRHTFATRKAEQGMAPATLAAILGHADIRSIMKYIHITQKAMDVAMVQYAEAPQAAAHEGQIQ